MAYEVKDNTGSMFPNDRKESANHPDAKGSAMIDGVEYWISGWNKKTQDGKSWRSLSFTRKEQKPAPKSKAGGTSRQTRNEEELDSDIPF